MTKTIVTSVILTIALSSLLTSLHAQTTQINGDLSVTGKAKTGSGDTYLGGQNATALGGGNNATGIYSLAAGISNYSLGSSSAAIGSNNQSLGISSLAFGQYNVAQQNNAVAIGASNYAFAGGSMIFGNYNTLGVSNVSGNYNSLALGTSNIATKTNSVVLGTGNISSAVGAVAFGNYATAESYYSLILGSYNLKPAVNATTWVATDPLFVVGNGTSDTARSNALTILKNGNASFKGVVKVLAGGDLSMGTFTAGTPPQ